MRKTILCSIASFIAALSVSAQTTWIADKAHTQITFSVTHLLISEVTGRFSDFDVTFHDANEDFTDGTIRVTIRTASINTGIEKRDNHLKSDDFLGAEKFPNITFESTLIEKTGKDTYKITGDLTIRDVTKSVVLDAKHNGTVTDPWGVTKAGFKATTSINRFDFGVKWGAALEAGGLVAGETVVLTLLMEFNKQ
ncbi:MAG: YceI family protein [Ignavibacteria bacterium]|nr:YceI family protein [Ignavibacteria bacterium]